LPFHSDEIAGDDGDLRFDDDRKSAAGSTRDKVGGREHDRSAALRVDQDRQQTRGVASLVLRRGGLGMILDVVALKRRLERAVSGMSRPEIAQEER